MRAVLCQALDWVLGPSFQGANVLTEEGHTGRGVAKRVAGLMKVPRWGSGLKSGESMKSGWLELL